MPRVLLAEKTGFKGKYIVFPLTKFMLESLELLGIKKERLYIVKRPEEINFFIESLVQPQRISITEPEFQNQLMLIRKAFLKNIRPDKTKKRRIYVQRRQAMNKRNIINEKELLKILKKYDFEIAEMENKSLKAQITLMSESNCYLGGHGAGTVHTLFMKPKSLVMEFFSPNYINHVYTPVAAMLSHNYYMLVPPVSPEASYIYGHDIYAPVGIVDFTLKNQLKK